MKTQPMFKLAILATCLTFIVACGQFEGSPSPTAPSAPVVPPAASSGATISGTVSGATGGVAATLAAVSFEIKVTVVGSGLSTVANAAGQFVLEGVPAGDIQLRFTGPGMNATITISRVQPGERIEIVVVVNGSTATVESDSRRGPEGEVENEQENPDEVEGTVLAVVTPCPNLSFTVGTTPVTTDVNTQFRDGSCVDVVNGRKVEVKGVRSNGSIRASRVEIEEMAETEVELEGVVSAASSITTCPNRTFTVGTTPVTTDVNTQFRDGSCADVVNGRKVEVKGVRSNGSIRASRVEIKKS